MAFGALKTVHSEQRTAMRAGHFRRMAMRRNRADRQMRGIKERRRKIVCRVETDAIAIPAWARAREVRGLSTGPDHVWLRRGDARALERLDRDSGGTPRVIEVEFRYCKVCGRPLMGDDAANRRALEQAGSTSWMLPCGEQCIEASKDGRWRRQ